MTAAWGTTPVTTAAWLAGSVTVGWKAGPGPATARRAGLFHRPEDRDSQAAGTE